MMTENIFCIDMEDWYHQSLVPDSFHGMESSVVKNTTRLLEIFRETNTKATFFCVGQVAAEHPDLIKAILSEGHEIASHGFSHKIIYKQSPEEFRSDIQASIKALSNVGGVKIKGFRAPSWSITKDSLWALDILQEEGFLYDSSIFPTRNFLYGIADADRFISERTVKGKPFLEIPPSTFKIFGKTFGFSGGFYFRALPAFFIRMCTNRFNKKGHPAVFYLHPVEIDRNIKKIPSLKLIDKIILELGVKGCEKKLIKILKRYKFNSIENFLENHTIKEVNPK